MKKLIIGLMVVILSMTTFTDTANSTIKKVAQTGLQFLKIDASARASAMGSAYTLLGHDASAIFYNPAGTAMMDRTFDLHTNMTQWFAGITYGAASFAYKLGGNLGTIGGSVVYADYGNDIIGTVVTSTEKGFTETGNVNVGAYAAGLSYAKRLTDKFSVGGQVKYAYQHLGKNQFQEGGKFHKNEVGGLAYDFGTIFYPGWKSLEFGMTVRNFSGQFEYQDTPFQLPLTFHIGLAMNVLDLFGDYQNKLNLAVDATHPRDYTERVLVGGEYWYNNMIALRAGYKFNYDEEGLTAGVGFQQTVGGLAVKIDYSYGAANQLNSINRFSIGIGF